MAEELQTRLQQFGILGLLRQLLPRRAERIIRQALSTAPDNIYATAFNHIISHVDQHHFPIMNLDSDYLIDNYPYIAIECCNYDHESEFEYERTTTKVLAYFAGIYSNAPSREEIPELLGPAIQYPPCLREPEHQCDVDVDLLTTLCSHHPAPVRDFPIALRIMAHETDSIFLDISYDWEGPPLDYTWTPETITNLTEQWNTAKRLLRTLKTVEQKLEQHPHYWSTIFTCWDSMCTQSKKGTHGQI